MFVFLVKEYFKVIFETCFKKLENVIFSLQVICPDVNYECWKDNTKTEIEIKDITEEVRTVSKNLWHIVSLFSAFKKYQLLVPV